MRAAPERFREICRQRRPPVVQVSGGEPLTREDVEDIIRAIRQPDGLPYVILLTNGSLLTPDRFLRLRGSGMDQFSVSLDFTRNLGTSPSRDPNDRSCAGPAGRAY